MKFLISPSKTMKHSNQKSEIHAVADKSILKMLQVMTIDEIQEKMNVNEKIAKLNYDRYQKFDSLSQALYTYDGLQFKQLELEKYNSDHFEYIDKHVRIVSALYGLVNPLHNVGLYRLEMKAPLFIKGISISNYWKLKMEKELQNEVIISLMSSEYAKILDESLKIVRVHFEIEKNKRFKTTKTIKICRGKFLNQCILLSIDTLEKMKKIKFDGYEYHSKSTKTDFYYVKKA